MLAIFLTSPEYGISLNVMAGMERIIAAGLLALGLSGDSAAEKPEPQTHDDACRYGIVEPDSPAAAWYPPLGGVAISSCPDE